MAAITTAVAALVLFGSIRAYRVVADQEMLEGAWSRPGDRVGCESTDDEFAALERRPASASRSGGPARGDCAG